MGAAVVPLLFALSAGSTVAQARESRRQAKDVGRDMENANLRQEALEREAREKIASDLSGEARTKQRNAQRARARATAGLPRGGTILTSPLGIVGEGPTILGG
ncbi:MAG TPA: hypothetical protein VJN63_09875 [Thermoplasmata archaeon]|nr:hypothetical protein [Thermoplasmata archaeon]